VSFAQKSVLLVQTLSALGFGTLRVGVVHGISEVLAQQHLNSWDVLGRGKRQCICNKLRWSLCFSFPSPTQLPLIKTPLEGVQRVRTPLGYSGNRNPQGQAVTEGCLLPHLCNPKLLSVAEDPPKGTLHMCSVAVLCHSVLLNGDRQPPSDPLREGEQQSVCRPGNSKLNCFWTGERIFPVVNLYPLVTSSR